MQARTTTVTTPAYGLQRASDSWSCCITSFPTQFIGHGSPRGGVMEIQQGTGVPWRSLRAIFVTLDFCLRFPVVVREASEGPRGGKIGTDARRRKNLAGRVSSCRVHHLGRVELSVAILERTLKSGSLVRGCAPSVRRMRSRLNISLRTLLLGNALHAPYARVLGTLQLG